MAKASPRAEVSAQVETLKSRVRELEGQMLRLMEAVHRQPLFMTAPSLKHGYVLLGGGPQYPAQAVFLLPFGILEASNPEATEIPIPGWSHLAYRPKSWRRQLHVKGRNLTAGQLAHTVEVEGWAEEEAAKNLDLPVEAIQEACRYARDNQAVIELEAAYERALLDQKGYIPHGARPVPR
jgi:uncharacterized protein (DUF433 family)